LFCEKYNAKLVAFVPIHFQTMYIGLLVILYKEERDFSEDELDFIELIRFQSANALYKTKLYQAVITTAKKERLLRSVISSIGSKLKVDEVLAILTQEISKIFGVGRVSVIQFPDLNDFTKWQIKYEYRVKKEYKSIENIKFFSEIGKFWGEKIIDRREPYYIENIQKSDIPELVKKTYNQMGLKTIIGIPVIKENNKWGGLFLSEYEDYRKWNAEDINLLMSVAEQIYVVITRAEFFATVQENAQREALLRKIIEAMRSTLDISEFKKIATREIGKALNADRCVLYQVDPKTDKFQVVDKNSEYRNSSKFESHVGIDLEEKEFYEFKRLFQIEKKELIVPDVEHPPFEYNPSIRKLLREYGVKSNYTMPIIFQDKLLGILYINFVKEKKVITEEEMDFFRELADQIGIAFYQMILYEQEKQTTEREKILRTVIQDFGTELNINERKKIIVTRIGKIFGADRCFIIEKLPGGTYKNIDEYSEYLSGPDVKTFVGVNIQEEEFKVWIDSALKHDLIISDMEKFIYDNNFQGTPLEKNIKNYNVKAALAVSICSGSIRLGFFALHYTKAKHFFSDEEVGLARSIAAQAGSALYQSILYENEKLAVKNEKLLRKTIQIISRSSLNIQETLKNLCIEVSNFFDADRVAVVGMPDYEDVTTYEFRYEYKKKEKIKGVKELGKNLRVLLYGKKNMLGKSELLLINNMEKDKIPGYYRKAFENIGVKSQLGVPIKEEGRVWGAMVISTIVNYKTWTAEDIESARIIANQVYIALNQAELYESVRKTADREALLKDILGEIKFSQSLDEAYNYILAKMATIFNTDRAIFFEVPHIVMEKTYVKYEYRRNEKVPSLIKSYIPNVYMDIFREIKEELEPYIINDIKEFYPYEQDAIDFIDKYGIRSILAVPFVRYNRDVKFLGIFSLCCEEQRDWKKEEIELIQAIARNVINVVWDITKLREIEEIRNAFILTLAHDLMVPVIGEKKALEYISSQPASVQIAEVQTIIEGLLENNHEISATLSKLIEIYNYEMGNKILEKGLCRPDEIMERAYEVNKPLAESKSVRVEFIIKEPIPEIRVDKKEIEKVFCIVLKNAIEYSPENETVEVEFKKSNDKYLAVGILDKGPGFPKEFEELVFKRYEMIKILGRKIGAGLSLYLAKLIVQEHNGMIKIDSKPGEGCTFCIYFPMNY